MYISAISNSYPIIMASHLVHLREESGCSQSLLCFCYLSYKKNIAANAAATPAPVRTTPFRAARPEGVEEAEAVVPDADADVDVDAVVPFVALDADAPLAVDDEEAQEADVGRVTLANAHKVSANCAVVFWSASSQAFATQQVTEVMKD